MPRIYPAPQEVSKEISDVSPEFTEILLGAKPDAALDESRKAEVEGEAERQAKKEKVAAAGGQLLGAALAFMGEMFSAKGESPETVQMAEMFQKRLSECLARGEDGRLRMTVTLPDESVLNRMAKSLAQILSSSPKQQDGVV